MGSARTLADAPEAPDPWRPYAVGFFYWLFVAVVYYWLVFRIRWI